MGCLGDWRGSRRKICSKSLAAAGRKHERSNAAATTRIVWPAPQSPSRTPLPLPSPLLKKSNSHPLPQPSSIPSPPHPNRPQPDQSLNHNAQECLHSFDFDRIARSCNHFTSPGQPKKSPLFFRCVVHEQQLDVIRQQPDQLTDEEWVSKINQVALQQHPNVCRVIGFSIKGRRRLLLMESPPSSRPVEDLLRHLNWDARLSIALAAAQALHFLHENSPFLQARGFGANNVLVSTSSSGGGTNVVKIDEVKLQLVLLDKNSQASKASNLRSFGILLLALLSGKRNIEEILVTDAASDGLFVKWATDMVNDRIKLSGIVDPKLLLYCNSLSAPTKLANFALSCITPDISRRPSMQAAISLLNSLRTQPTDHHRNSSRNNMSTPTLGRSATFCYNTTGRRDLTPPPLRTTAAVSPLHLRSSGARSAGASPARYTPASDIFYRMLPP